MEKFLSSLEKAALLKKAGIVSSLLEGRGARLKELSGPYDPGKSPEGNWSEAGWYGGPNSGGYEGYRGENTVFRVSLSNRQFVILKVERKYVNGSSFSTNHDRDYPGDYCPCCGTFYYVFASEGQDVDSLRIERGEIEELLKSADRHLPEALEMIREDITRVMTKLK